MNPNSIARACLRTGPPATSERPTVSSPAPAYRASSANDSGATSSASGSAHRMLRQDYALITAG